MPMFQVLRDVASGVTGQLTKGDRVDLDAGVVEWLNSQVEGGALKPVAKSESKEQK